MKSTIEILEPIAALSLNRKGANIRVTDRYGTRLHFSVYLTSEIIGALQEIEREFYRSVPEESK